MLFTILYHKNARITPARAGKTTNLHNTTITGEDHPRLCGKDGLFFRKNAPMTGSPPLMRERRCITFAQPQVGGITPARAGKTYTELGNYLGTKDHPRSCGKDLTFSVASESFLGSPPLVRERPEQFRRKAQKGRITPARAGKTNKEYAQIITEKDHPRSCGKDGCQLRSHRHGGGSPPLVRERPFV